MIKLPEKFTGKKPLFLFLLVFCGICILSSSDTGDGYLDMLKKKVPGYERHISGNFAPMWEPLARQMAGDYGLENGIALDIGSGTSPFLIELAGITGMRCYAVDIDPWSLRLLAAFIDQADMTGRVIPVEADWQDLPLRDEFADFIFSRGTIPFVDDKVQVIRETWRVLKPGGTAIIGHGGFGRLISPGYREQLLRQRLKWESDTSERPAGWDGPGENLPDLAREAGIPEEKYRLIPEPPVGWWLEIKK
jgi:SAM-dependent methyltransferase